MRRLVAVVLLVALGGGLWLRGFEPVLVQPPTKEMVLGELSQEGTSEVELAANRLVQGLLKGDAALIWALLGKDLRSIYDPATFKGQWQKVKWARLIKTPKVSGVWAEAVIELVSADGNRPQRYLAIFHWEKTGWRLFATIDLDKS